MSAVTVHFVVPGALDQRTGGYGYDRRIVRALRDLDREVVVHELAGRFPRADGVARAAARQALEAMDDGALPVIDGLALPAFQGCTDGLPSPWIALVHHPLALETGLRPDQAALLFELERELLQRATRIIVTSGRTRRDLAAYDVPAARIAVVSPGTEPAPLARGFRGGPVHLLCIGALTPRKGHLVLIEALGALRDLDWRLTCVGSRERDPAHAMAVADLIRRRDLGGRIALTGELDDAERDRCLDAADVFVLASHHEGYGMVLAEALARGLPVVATRAGAIAETVPQDAGVLVPPGDAGALAAALRRVIGDRELRRSLAAGARAARGALPDWRDAGRRFAAQLDGVVDGAGVRAGLATTA